MRYTRAGVSATYRGDVTLSLQDITRMSTLSYDLVFLREVAENTHIYTGNHGEVAMFFSPRENLIFRLPGNSTSCMHIDTRIFVDEAANATISPRPPPRNPGTPFNTNNFLVVYIINAHGEALARIPSKWVSPSKEICMNARDDPR